MANANFDSTSMTSKAISLVVAIVVFACVLIPVLNAMENGNSGGGSGDEGRPQILTNSGEYTYASMDSNTHTMRIQLVDDDFILTVDGQQIDVGFGYVPWDNENPPTVTNTLTLITGNIDDSPAFIFLDGTGAVISYDYEYVINLVENSDVTLTITGTGVTHDSEEFSMNVECYISTSGDYVMAENPKVLEDTTIRLCSMGQTPKYSTEIRVNDGTILFEGYTENYPIYNYIGTLNTLSDMTNVDLNHDDWVCTPQYESASGYYVLNSVDCTRTERLQGIETPDIDVTDTCSATLFLVPAEITVASSDSGSDSDGGIVGTLIGIIPVFVALGLIIAVVSMFYNPNRMD